MEGKLVIFCAPSGSGKTTLLRAVLPEFPELEFSVSACSRQPRDGEVHGKDYYFLSDEKFLKKIDDGKFLEWEEVYSGNFYGTLISEVERIWRKGKHVIFDVDVIGGLNIKKKYPDKSLAIFIQPPSLEELHKRLSKRGTETPESLEKRISKAEYELGFANQFDIRIINGDLDKAIMEVKQAIASFLE